MAKSFIIKLVCKILGKAIPYVCSKDSRAKETFFNLPSDLTISLGVFGEGEYLVLHKTKNQILKVSKKVDDVDLKIIFKSRKAAKMVMLGKIGVAQSYARHDLLLAGNINTAVALVRVIDLCEYYLFPRFITYKFLPKMKKQFSSIPLYFYCLFGSQSLIKIEREELEKKNNKKKKDHSGNFGKACKVEKGESVSESETKETSQTLSEDNSAETLINEGLNGSAEVFDEEKVNDTAESLNEQSLSEIAQTAGLENLNESAKKVSAVNVNEGVLTLSKENVNEGAQTLSKESVNEGAQTLSEESLKANAKPSKN